MKTPPFYVCLSENKKCYALYRTPRWLDWPAKHLQVRVDFDDYISLSSLLSSIFS